MSDVQSKDIDVSMVDECDPSAASNTSRIRGATAKWERIKIKNVEQWEPSVREKELLRRTWSDDFEFLYDLGSSIYCYIFEHNPNCKQLFPSLLKYGDKWKDSREFRAQALKFVQTISQVVKNIYHMDSLEPYLYGIGQLHCKYADRGFKSEYWEDFQDAMEHSLAEHASGLADLSDPDRREAVIVWRTLALFIIAHMKAGFFDGLKSINKHPALA
nr:Globin domain containing protein [Haemonchus contortus]